MKNFRLHPMLDRALGTTIRNLSTFFLLGAIVFVPLHLGHAFLFRNVLEVHELRGDISEFPEGRKVRGVGPAELDEERSTLMILVLVEAASAIFIVGAARRVVEVDDEGGVPTVADAFRHAADSLRRMDLRGLRSTALPVGLLVGAAAAWLTYRTGALGTELLGNDKTFVGIGVTRGVALAIFTAFVVGPVAVSTRAAPKREPRSLDLY